MARAKNPQPACPHPDGKLAQKNPPVCFPCYQRAYNQAKPERRYRVRYGMSDALLKRFVGAHPECNICGAAWVQIGNKLQSTSMCVDHDHRTGFIRGAICRGCNVTIGKFDKYGVAWRDRALRLRGAEWTENAMIYVGL